MKKITIEFQDENSTEFKVDASGLTYRELLVLARELLQRQAWAHKLPGDGQVIQIEPGECGPKIRATVGIVDWQVALVADEFYLAAMYQFFAIQNRAMAQAAQNAQALAGLQHGGRDGFIRGVGRG